MLHPLGANLQSLNDLYNNETLTPPTSYPTLAHIQQSGSVGGEGDLVDEDTNSIVEDLEETACTAPGFGRRPTDSHHTISDSTPVGAF